jgi:hypothetical protein
VTVGAVGAALDREDGHPESKKGESRQDGRKQDCAQATADRSKHPAGEEQSRRDTPEHIARRDACTPSSWRKVADLSERS